MRLVQARVPDLEFKLLKQRAKASGKTMQEIVQEALRAHLLDDRVDPHDPLFTDFPLVKATGRKEDTSRRVDEILYGEDD